MITKHATLAALAALAASAPARAAVTISTAATQNMSCSGGVCAPTAADAGLNVTDLENMLASGNVTVTTTGSGVEAENISVIANLAWGKTSLTLDASQSISVSARILARVGSGLSLMAPYSYPAALSFSGKGHIAFKSLASVLTINGSQYTLVDSVQGLANVVASNPGGFFALANSYDASGDGTYTHTPVATPFTGSFEGLGNAISKLSIKTIGENAALFFGGGNVADLNLLQVDVEADINNDDYFGSAALTTFNDSTIARVHATGRVRSRRGMIGGLVMQNEGTITNCYSTVSVNGRRTYGAGGLVEENYGTISGSYAAGSVTTSPQSSRASASVGGLAASSVGSIANSYASGAVSLVGSHGPVGGLVGVNSGEYAGGYVSNSYSLGAVSGGTSGGFAGYNDGGYNGGGVTDDYWDTTTSGTDVGVGSGPSNGITGLTTEQLQSGLPAGFDPAIWAEDPNINNGFPYLIANPPPK